MQINNEIHIGDDIETENTIDTTKTNIKEEETTTTKVDSDEVQKNIDTITKLKNNIDELKSLNKSSKKQLKEMGMPKGRIRKLEETLSEMSADDVEALSIDEINILLGKNITNAINEICSNDLTQSKEMKKDFIKYFRDSLSYEKQLSNIEAEFSKSIKSADIELGYINHESLYLNSLIQLEEKIKDDSIDEDKKKKLQISLYQMLDSINLERVKAYARNKPKKVVDREVKKLDNIFSNFVKNLNKDEYVFIDPRADDYNNRIDEAIKQILPEDYKIYYKELTYLLIKKYSSYNNLKNNRVFVSTLLRNIRAIQFKQMDTQSEKFISSLIELIDIYKNN